jgi:hypothetical protein
MKISKAVYKNIPALRFETEKISALFLPEHGGKCASLSDIRTKREFLVQKPGKQYKKLAYAGNYEEAECSGFDDMCPTIDSYYYDRYPWQGIEVPDHGEVCGLKWQYEVQNNICHMQTSSPRFGYSFEKWISDDRGGIKIDYRITNNTQFDFDFVYAVHCMIQAEKDGSIVLPGVKKRQKAAMVFSSDPARGTFGKSFIWQANTPGLDITPGAEVKESYKYFFEEPLSAGCCEYRYKDGTGIIMNYSADKLPYLGIWTNWNDFQGLCNIAFEPSSGTFDRPDIARKLGQFSVIPPHGKYEWNITFATKKY